MKSMNCIKCEKHLENLNEEKNSNQPDGGSEFYTYGHFGSRITDTMGNTIHYINVCDDCLEDAKSRGLCVEKINLNW